MEQCGWMGGWVGVWAWSRGTTRLEQLDYPAKVMVLGRYQLHSQWTRRLRPQSACTLHSANQTVTSASALIVHLWRNGEPPPVCRLCKDMMLQWHRLPFPSAFSLHAFVEIAPLHDPTWQRWERSPQNVFKTVQTKPSVNTHACCLQQYCIRIVTSVTPLVCTVYLAQGWLHQKDSRW